MYVSNITGPLSNHGQREIRGGAGERVEQWQQLHSKAVLEELEVVNIINVEHCDAFLKLTWKHFVTTSYLSHQLFLRESRVGISVSRFFHLPHANVGIRQKADEDVHLGKH